MVQSFIKYAMPGAKAEYTMTLGELIALGYDTDDKLHLSADYYPIYDESHRAELNDKIIRHYALREIGQETVQQFIWYLGVTMAEIMPYFNQRYKSAAIEYDPLSTIDTTTDSSTGSESQSSSRGTSTQDSTSTTTSKTDNQSTTTSKADNQSSTTSKSFDSDVPATGVVGDFARYASHANEATADSNGTSSSTQDSTGMSSSTQDTSGHSTATSATDYSHGSMSGKGTSHTTGRTQGGASLVNAYRQAIINVDMEIVQSLEPCFMQLWGSYDMIFNKVYC